MRHRMKDRYRRLSFITDIQGMRNAIGEMHGLFHPPQPPLIRRASAPGKDGLPDEEWFRRTIAEKVAGHPENAMEWPFFKEPIFSSPLVGFVRGDDPIFERLKGVIGPHHFTPWEIMRWQALNKGVEPPHANDLGVVAFVLPFTEQIARDNARSCLWPSERWAQARLMGEMFSQVMVREIVAHLMSMGILAVAPDATPMFRKRRYPGVGWASPWSHRHIAYAAGLGTFGMHDFLITDSGCAHRLGSFVVNLRLNPDRKRPEDIHAHCLHHQGVPCLRCAARCPVGAITEGGHDKEACSRRVASSLVYCNTHYHIFIYGCGLCAAGVPCGRKIPAASSGSLHE
jgi:hypothetical protein